MSGRFRKILYTTTALVPLGFAPVSANPLGSQVVGGSANVQGQGTASVTVTQSTDKAIINWNTFNIGTNETTRFVQPSSSSVTLNRVTGSLGASAIDGNLQANGRVFLVNPDGILFGAGARINTGSFLATTNDIRNADFMAGKFQFTIPGRLDASIVNQGTITAQSGGFAALVAPGVRNTGTITATLGKVGLASSNGFSLDMYGDNLITLQVGDQIASTVKDVATGQPLKALVSNEGKIKANGGQVQLTAAAARIVVDSIINNKGLIEANSIGKHNGMVVLSAATGASKPAGAPTQTIKLAGKISAAGKPNSTTGGKIQVTGESIELAGATLDASGRAGGGTVLVGGDWSGGESNCRARIEREREA
jgi:filamentous hemagglutinin family protein